MDINYKFTKQQSAIILNMLPILFYTTIIVIALISGRHDEFYNNFIEALFYFIFPPLSIITLMIAGVMLLILGRFIFGIHANSKQCVGGCAEEEKKMNNIIRFFEFTNIILFIIFISYTLFIAQPKNEQDIQKSRNESIINMRHEKNNTKVAHITAKTYVIPEKYKKQLQEIKCNFEDGNPLDNILVAQQNISNNDFVSARQNFQWANDKNIKHRKMISVIYQDMIGPYKNNSEKLTEFMNKNEDDPVFELSSKLAILEFIFYKIASGEKEISDITDQEWKRMKEDLTQTTILSVVSCE